MRKSGLEFSVALAGIMVVITVAVAAAYNLPIRDPDGNTGPSFVRIPVLLALVLLVDVIPRIVYRAASFPDLRRAAREVVRERWSLPNLRFSLIGLVTWYATYFAIRNLKGFVPFVNERLYDSELDALDAFLFVGHDPAALMHSVLGTGWAAHVLAFAYVGWIALIPLSLAIALVWVRKSSIGAWWVTAVSIDWVLGVALNYMLPTLGPIYVRPGDFGNLPHTGVAELQSSMWDVRVDILADPWGAHGVQNIAAFASLHVAIATTACFVAAGFGAHRYLVRALWAFLALTMLATVYFGWHYVSDVVVGFLLGWAGAWLGALATGKVPGLPSRARATPAVMNVRVPADE